MNEDSLVSTKSRETGKGAERLQQYDNIYLAPPFSVLEPGKIREKFPQLSNFWIYGCDFAIRRNGSEREIRSNSGVLIGFRHDNSRVINIDHHAETPEMARFVSTTNLAILFVQTEGTIPQGNVVLLNHNDTDSTLSALILTGKLSPSDRFGQAAIAADHTGERNDIADLLNAISAKKDLVFSVDCLNKLLRGEQLPEEAIELLNKRIAERQVLEEFIRTGGLENMGNGVLFGRFTGPVRSEFIPAMVPEARIFVLASPLGEGTDENTWDIKVRAGQSFPKGMNLQRLELPSWTGRWNAGGTKRQGGWHGEDPRDYALLVVQRLTLSK
ncbi:MAG TPA: hypothetical protein VMW41_05665 [Candidatus Bathyarchaeia archaeon]|nr:hypothetical protein [Candidatus Bathyarchaeia archaeon]